MGINELLEDVQIIAIVCNQWGDTGKGKFSDYFASTWADVVARGTGGNNAGHTVVVNGKTRVFHLLPAGIVNDAQGKITVLGNGMVIDLKSLCEELDELDKEGASYRNLIISKDANVIMPHHILFDKARDKSQKAGGVGSTGRGIGPCYTDKIARRGITLGDFFDKNKLGKKIDKQLEFYSSFGLKCDDIILEAEKYFERIKVYVKDSVSEMHKFKREGKKILIEGAQGLLLSIEHGTYPYVTSSDCSINGTAAGVGFSAGDVDLTLGIVKFPFMTRVGAGPFPTEFGGELSEKYCAEEITKKDELKKYGIAFSENNGKLSYNANSENIKEMMNSEDEFVCGIGVRLAAGEYGATTGRPRRTGWADAVAGKYGVGINGQLMILTKVDSISGMKNFKICFGYETPSGASEDFSKDESFLRNAKPIYREYDGYGDISNYKEFSKLPESLKAAIGDFEKFTGGKVAIISVGAERDQTIVVD